MEHPPDAYSITNPPITGTFLRVLLLFSMMQRSRPKMENRTTNYSIRLESAFHRSLFLHSFIFSPAPYFISFLSKHRVIAPSSSIREIRFKD